MVKLKFIIILVGMLVFSNTSIASRIIIPMDEQQNNHLKAYGLTYWVLRNGEEANWLLNYRGGSFMLPFKSEIENECQIRGIKFEIISEGQVSEILLNIAKPDVNMELVKLLKAPKIAVYSPKTKQHGMMLLPWCLPMLKFLMK